MGGFAASDYLFHSLKERLEPFDIMVSRPEIHLLVSLGCIQGSLLTKNLLPSNKAVAHGAISFFIDRRVKIRVAKYTFGVCCNIPYRPDDEEHDRREASKYMSASGAWYIPGAFEIILPRVRGLRKQNTYLGLTHVISQGTQVTETKEFRRSFTRISKNINELRSIKTSIACYRGSDIQPEWVDVEPGMFDPTKYSSLH